MSAALKAMVEAIWAEIDRQIRAEGIRDHVSTATRFDKPNYLGETHPNVARIQGNVDLEKVARAGLEALDGDALAMALYELDPLTEPADPDEPHEPLNGVNPVSWTDAGEDYRQAVRREANALVAILKAAP
jgi:hypothetical protein